MPRKAHDIEITEHPGDLYPNLEAAQAASLATVVPLLADTVRRLLEGGQLVIVDGRVIVAPNG